MIMQGDEDPGPKIPYLDGLPMEYWVVPPRTPLAALPGLNVSLPSLHQTSRTARTATRAGLVSKPTRHSLLASR